MNSPVELNHYCLVEIFTYLPIKDRIRLERVCKKWLDASRASWYNFKTLDLNKFMDKGAFNSRIEILRSLLSHCRHYVKEIKMTQSFKELEEIFLLTIVNQCPKLDAIHYTGFFTDSLRLLEPKGRNITKLRLDLLDQYGDIISNYGDVKVFKSSIKKLELKYFGILYNYKPAAIYLKYLPTEPIEEIHFQDCFNLKIKEISQILPKFQNLQVLNLSGSLPDKRSIDLLIDTMKKFKLKELDISNNKNAVDDSLLIESACALKDLIKLNISNNYYITDDGLAIITNLPNLEHLNIDFLDKVRGKVAMNLPKLKHLSCIDCWLSHRGMINFIKTSDKIIKIQMGRFDYVKKNLIDTSIRAAKLHKKAVSLEIFSNYIQDFSEVEDVLKKICKNSPSIKYYLSYSYKKLVLKTSFAINEALF